MAFMCLWSPLLKIHVLKEVLLTLDAFLKLGTVRKWHMLTQRQQLRHSKMYLLIGWEGSVYIYRRRIYSPNYIDY